MDPITWLSQMFGFLPNMLQGCIEVISWCLSVSPRDCLQTVATFVFAVDAVSGSVLGLAISSINNPVVDMPLFVVMFGAGFVLYGIFSVAKWVLELFT